jgi:hypothetical protein
VRGGEIELGRDVAVRDCASRFSSRPSTISMAPPMVPSALAPEVTSRTIVFWPCAQSPVAATAGAASASMRAATVRRREVLAAFIMVRT